MQSDRVNKTASLPYPHWLGIQGVQINAKNNAGKRAVFRKAPEGHGWPSLPACVRRPPATVLAFTL